MLNKLTYLFNIKGKIEDKEGIKYLIKIIILIMNLFIIYLLYLII